jgi:hypothetical protein
MQYGRFTIPTFGCKKSSYLNNPTKGCCFQPAGRITQGQDSNFQLNQSGYTTFNLRRAMQQPTFTNLNSCRRKAQDFALNQPTRKSNAVQSAFPYK